MALPDSGQVAVITANEEIKPNLVDLNLSCRNKVVQDRFKQNREEKTSFFVIDVGKMVSGIKRHITFYTQRLPHAIAITNVVDRGDVVLAIASHQKTLSSAASVLTGGVYTGEKFLPEVQGVIGKTVEIVRRSELHTYTVIPKR